MKIFFPLAIASVGCLLTGQSVAMKNTERSFQASCDVVWKAAVSVAKSKQYRIISIAKDEQILSVSAGGVWSGERILSLSLAAQGEHGCVGTAQSRFSGLAHSDGPDLLERVQVELVGESMDRDSKAFRKYKDCVDNSLTNSSKCEARLRRDQAAHDATPAPADDLWKNTPKQEAQR